MSRGWKSKVCMLSLGCHVVAAFIQANGENSSQSCCLRIMETLWEKTITTEYWFVICTHSFNIYLCDSVTFFSMVIPRIRILRNIALLIPLMQKVMVRHSLVRCSHLSGTYCATVLCHLSFKNWTLFTDTDCKILWGIENGTERCAVISKHPHLKI